MENAGENLQSLAAATSCSLLPCLSFSRIVLSHETHYVRMSQTNEDYPL